MELKLKWWYGNWWAEQKNERGNCGDFVKITSPCEPFFCSFMRSLFFIFNYLNCCEAAA